MYAIIKIKGKQYRVAQGDVIDVDLLDEQNGSKLEFKDVLFFNNGSAITLGEPFVAGCTVLGEIVSSDIAGQKIESVKYKRSHNQYRKFGHRQHYSRIRINEIHQAKEKESKAKGSKHHGP